MRVFQGVLLTETRSSYFSRSDRGDVLVGTDPSGWALRLHGPCAQQEPDAEYGSSRIWTQRLGSHVEKGGTSAAVFIYLFLEVF